MTQNQTQISIELKSSSRRDAGRGFMVICDAIVDGQESDVIFWDPENEGQIRPGACLSVTMDGQNAKWNTHNGKTSFQIRPQANFQFTQEGSNEPPAGQQKAYGTKPSQQTDNKSAEEILERAAELVVIYARTLQEAGVPSEDIGICAAQAPTIVSSWWFGTGGKWA